MLFLAGEYPGLRPVKYPLQIYSPSGGFLSQAVYLEYLVAYVDYLKLKICEAELQNQNNY
jgi:hypothetical protein